MDMVEKVARAICLHRAAPACDCKAYGECRGLRENVLSGFNPLLDQARAAIAAMREPTEGMVEAGDDIADGLGDNVAPGEAANVYGAMIDAALTSEGK